MFSSDRKVDDPFATRLRNSSEHVQSVRITKNREYFILDRLGNSSGRGFERSDQSISKFPALDKSGPLKHMSQTKSRFSFNKTVAEDLPSVREFSHGHSSSRLEKDGPSRQLYMKAEQMVHENSNLGSLVDPLVAAQIKRNKKIIDSLMDREKQKTVQARLSQEFSNVSFFRPKDVAKQRTLLDRSNSPLSAHETEPQSIKVGVPSEQKGPELSKSQVGTEEQPQLGSMSTDQGLNFNYTSIVDRISTKSHPESLDEVGSADQLTAVVATKQWFLPSMECMRLSSYAALSHEDKQRLYGLSFANYQQANLPTRYQDALKVSKDKLAKYFKSIKPAEERLEIVGLQKWYLESLAKSPAPVSADLEQYFGAKSRVFAYTLHSLADQLGRVRREAADLLSLTATDLFRFIDEVTGMFGKFVGQMDAKREKDYKQIEKVYQAMVLDQTKKVHALERDHEARKNEIKFLHKSIHTMKSKITNDYVVISNLRREIEFTREYSRITEEENRKITATINTLFEDFRTLDATSENLKKYIDGYEQNIEIGKMSTEYLKKNYEREINAGLNPKQKHELYRILTQDDLPYDEFMTFDKGCSTRDLFSVNTVTIGFGKIKADIDKVNVGTQKVETKPRTRDANVQTHHQALERQNTLKEGSSDDEYSLNNSLYKKKVMDRYRLEHMVVAPSDRRSILVKQTSIVPDTITELMELSQGDLDMPHDGRYGNSVLPSATEFMLPRPASKKDQVYRSSRVSFSLKIPSHRALHKKSFDKSEEDGDMIDNSRNFSSAVANLQVPGGQPGKATGHKLKKAGKNVMVSQRTINNFKPDVPSPVESVNGSVNLEKSPKTLVEIENYDNYRENKLRNELIRHKQQFKTLSNRMASCGDDTQRAAQIQAMLDSSALIIDKIEKQLKTFRKTSEVVEKLSQFRPGANPIQSRQL